ncbi:hypothetical protein [Streptomyces sp. NPDC086989]|uniref:hypothetical protein n=1 Tax=Streptomyces sp. NPDC086989 TaxID=3365764 RepID=UPI00381539E6
MLTSATFLRETADLRADLYTLAPYPIVSPRAVLDEDPGLPETWWKEMTAALDPLADVEPPADREAVREEYLRRVIPQLSAAAGRASTSRSYTIFQTRSSSR